MKKIKTKDIFIKIFKIKKYRQKLDEIILNFFGLTTKSNSNYFNYKQEKITLEIILFIDNEYVLKIIIHDTQKLFTISKKFYINLSFLKENKYHILLRPCYWEIYCTYCQENIKNSPQILLIAAILNCKTIKEVEEVFNYLTIFTNKEKKEILKIIELNK